MVHLMMMGIHWLPPGDLLSLKFQSSTETFLHESILTLPERS
jgi:hypothetical protein